MNPNQDYLIDPQLSVTLINWLSWTMVVLGVIKLVIFSIGAYKPSVYDGMKSDGLRKFFVGTGNRYVFGWLGLATLLFGVFGLACGAIFFRLFGL